MTMKNIKNLGLICQIHPKYIKIWGNTDLFIFIILKILLKPFKKLYDLTLVAKLGK